MRDRYFMEDENELPYLVSSKAHNNNSRNRFYKTDSGKLYVAALELYDERRLDEALTLLDILIDRHPQDDRYWNDKGNIFYLLAEKEGIFGEKYYEKSLKCYNIAIKLNSKDNTLKKNKAILLINYAGILYNQDEYMSAIHKIDDALPLMNKTNVDDDYFARAWNIKGLCYHFMGNPEALKCYDEALKYNPDDEVIKGNKDAFRHY